MNRTAKMLLDKWADKKTTFKDFKSYKGWKGSSMVNCIVAEQLATIAAKEIEERRKAHKVLVHINHSLAKELEKVSNMYLRARHTEAERWKKEISGLVTVIEFAIDEHRKACKHPSKCETKQNLIKEQKRILKLIK